jgi:hypothetical protein
VGYFTWSRFLISSTHHNLCTFVTSWFVAKDNFFVLGLLCYYWLSFCSHESFVHRIFIWFSFTIFFFFGLCLLVFSFASYFCWMGSHPWFLFIIFFFFFLYYLYTLTRTFFYTIDNRKLLRFLLHWNECLIRNELWIVFHLNFQSCKFLFEKSWVAMEEWIF